MAFPTIPKLPQTPHKSLPPLIAVEGCHSGQRLGGYQPSIHNKSWIYNFCTVSQIGLFWKSIHFLFSQSPQKTRALGEWGSCSCHFSPFFPSGNTSTQIDSSHAGSQFFSQAMLVVSRSVVQFEAIGRFFGEDLRSEAYYKTPSSSELSVQLRNPYTYCWWLKSC